MNRITADPPPAYSPVQALRYGWDRFTRCLGPWVAGTFLVVAVTGGVMVGFALLFGSVFAAAPPTVDPYTGDLTYASNGFLTGIGVDSILLLGVGVVVGGMAQTQLSRAAFETTERGAIAFPVFTSTALLGPLAAGGLIAGAISALGLLGCCVGALVVGFFVQFSAYPILDGTVTTGWAGVTASVRFVWGNVGQVLAYCLLVLGGGFAVVLAAGLFGVFAPLLGQLLQALVAVLLIPVFVIGQAYTYRSLTRQQAAARYPVRSLEPPSVAQ